MMNFIKYDKLINTPFLKWQYLIDSGLSIEMAKEWNDNKYLKKIRTYFSGTTILEINDLYNFLISKNFEEYKSQEISKMAFSGKIEIIEEFIKEFIYIISVKNHDIDYFILRGWGIKNSQEKLKNFFKQGPNSISSKREKSILYDQWFCKSRKIGAAYSHTKQSHLSYSFMEKEIEKKLISSNHIISPFFSPCIHNELNQLYHKKNFIHDIFVDNKFIIEYNGSYWHKDFIVFPDKFSKDDYMFEIKKAYNCLELVKRKNEIKYIIIWENDFKNIEEILEFINLCFLSNSKFFSSRDLDIDLYNNYRQEKIEENKKHNLFKDIVLRISQESHCESKKVAAIAVRNGRIISTGINGSPSGVINCDDHFGEEYKLRNLKVSYDEWIKTPEWREEHHSWSNELEVHAEQALICEAAKNGINLSNIDIYVSLEPCIHCSKLLASLKPNRIFYVNSYDKSSSASKDLLNKCGILIQKI